jgi:prevent-host-death family protein
MSMSIAQTISTKQLREDLAEILEQVAIGKREFIVSKFGKQKARIIPVDNSVQLKSHKRFSDLTISGLWKDHPLVRDSASWVRDIRKKENSRNTAKNT